MNKKLANKFAFLQGCCIDVLSEEDEVCVVSKVETNLDTILKEIFEVDPISGCPKGDIAYYMSANGNPQVKDWIQCNLLQPRSVLLGSDPSKVSDDLINEFSRRKGESTEDYAARLVSIRTEAEENIKKFQVSNE